MWTPSSQPDVPPNLAELTVRPPNPLLSPVYLFLWPRTFFGYWGTKPAPLLTAFLAWMFGMAGVIDRIEMQALRGSSRVVDLLDDWALYLSAVFIGGILTGLIYYLIGGWWYRLRIRWSGDREADKLTARRVYVITAMVAAVPVLVATALEFLAYESPRQALDAMEFWWLYLVLLLFPYWSIWTSYSAVRAVFQTRRAPAMMWFGILPVLFYLGVHSVLFFTVFVAEFDPAPDLANKNSFQSPTFRFDYPGNWWVDEMDDGFDPYVDVMIEAPQDAIFRVILFPSDYTTGEELEVTLDEFRDLGSEVRTITKFSSDHRRTGDGATIMVVTSQGSLWARMFVAEVAPGWMLETREFAEVGVKQRVLPGFELIVSTLTVDPGPLE